MGNPINNTDPSGHSTIRSTVFLLAVECPGMTEETLPRHRGEVSCNWPGGDTFTIIQRGDLQGISLGTLFAGNTIITHGHFPSTTSSYPDNVALVIRGYRRDLHVSAKEFFTSWVEHQDAGTTVIKLPMLETNLGDNARLGRSTDLLNLNSIHNVVRSHMACQDHTCLVDRRYTVSRLSTPGALSLQGIDNFGKSNLPLIIWNDYLQGDERGSSGGGVYTEFGRLIGNRWASIHTERQILGGLLGTRSENKEDLGALIPSLHQHAWWVRVNHTYQYCR